MPASSAIFCGELDARADAAAALVGTLRRCEALAGALVAEQGRLASAAIAAEDAFGLSAVAGQAVLAAMAEALQRTVESRAGLVAAHRRLEQLGKRMGHDLSMYGDTGKPPEDPKNPFTTAVAMDPVAG